MRPQAPTVTPIRLAATATPAPRQTPTPARAGLPTESPTAPPIAAATTTQPAVLIEAEDLLARRTVEGFLARLVQDQAESAFRLYLSDAAQQTAAGQLLSAFEAPNPPLVGATVLTVERLPGARYRVEARLQRSVEGDGGLVAQQMSLTLINSHGLWLIDTISVAELERP